MSTQTDPLNMDGNASFHIADVNPENLSTPEMAAFHQTQATLAVAFEQRTANLLKMLDYTVDAALFNTLMRTIEKRLGL